MKRINRPEAHQKLASFKAKNKNAKWNDFRNYASGKLYEQVRKDLFIAQGWLCAYCETKIPSDDCKKHHRRIEHFHSKGDQCNLDYDITFDWKNLLGVCRGGSDKSNTEQYEVPANLTCDAHKERMESTGGYSKNWHGSLLFPTQIPENVSFFTFEKNTGKLAANIEVCSRFNLQPNNFDTTAELVNNTILSLNLNCRRLNEARREILFERERIIKKVRETGNKGYLNFFYNKWLTDNSLPFSTTRKCLVRL
ncbi:TIGR02646 family protein [Pseudoalteromonas luteoviolacea]|uniref:retron Ec78 anti-phage system effector HNH endonuclease PtuB n=1 Tax=Pseudoalteromonas luteoviolacea TaxID=43657 RepID=UPI001B39FAD3|nr:retron Ec78 anti-phage system effector HNH endonuclease PtuB [Pseudoalteromonas luteoviolacea]MBQ4876272.1 TIGR02646 family protein [Pseudoalteromonas luteoviolacea]MBQ4906306.1 TIGR02646 family protein [Pseudoalteromonas luteoviolacea]